MGPPSWTCHAFFLLARRHGSPLPRPCVLPRLTFPLHCILPAGLPRQMACAQPDRTTVYSGSLQCTFRERPPRYFRRFSLTVSPKFWCPTSMRIARERLKKLCMQNGLTLSQLLKNAEVSKNAYYSLARKDTVLPKSVLAIADHLGVRPSAFLEERPEEDRWKILLEDLERISTRNPDADRDNIRHTLLLLEEPPIERLRRALTRGQKLDLHGRRG